MPLVCVECSDSRRSTVALDQTNSQIEGHWKVLGVNFDGNADANYGTDDDLLVRLAVAQYLPLVYAGLWFVDFRLEHKGGLIWDVLARYGTRPPKMPDQTPGQQGGWSTPDANGNVPSLTFDTTGATAHITQCKDFGQDVYTYAGGTLTDYQNQIGQNDDTVEGVDVVVPQFLFQETHYFSNDQMTRSFKVALFQLTGTVNDAAFRGFAFGEVLFLGVRGSKKGSENWELTFQFSALPNKVNFPVGVGDKVITVTSKRGWEYLWIRFEKIENGNNHILRPRHAVVNKVYSYESFSRLNIGTHS